MRRAARIDQNHGALTELRFVITGPPRTKKNHGRIVTRGRPRILPSRAFEQWNNSAQVLLASLRIAYRGVVPILFPVNCCALFYRDALRGDAVGYYQALADALQEGGIVENDSLIVAWDGSRMLKDAEFPRIEVVLTRADSAAEAVSKVLRET